MNNFEYIKWYWKHDNENEPVILFYEVDLENERYAVRMAEVYADRAVKPVIEEGFEFITEAPIPEIKEINADPEYFAEIITKEGFERIYKQSIYTDDICFPEKE